MARDKTDKTDKSPNAATATPAANEWGIPDWRDAAAYGDVKRWTFNRWRWEFYRRRDDLRHYFDAQAAKTYLYWKRFAGKEGFPAAHLRPDESGFCATVSVQARQRFGYSALPNPRIGEQPEGVIRPWATDCAIDSRGGDYPKNTVGELLNFFEVTLTDEQTRDLRSTLNGLSIEIERHEVAVIFDLNRPLQAQIQSALGMLKNEQGILHGKTLQKRRHPDRWLQYLRTLDAREAGLSWQEITDAFFSEGVIDRRKDPSGGYRAPDPQAARDMWQAADALRVNF